MAIYLEKLRIKAGYNTLQSFCDAYNKATGERMSVGALCKYELWPSEHRMGKQRLDNVSKFLELSKFQKKKLESFFTEEKELRNMSPSSLPPKMPAKKKAKKKGYTFVKRKSTYKRMPKKTFSQPNSMPPGMNEAGNFLILVKERAPLLGDKINDIAVLTALFMEANGVKTK